ncbi:trypsin-like peptidase domain-containing protein [Bradyrhizobium brasilense]|uniref:trypsin-like peptidase domain-containing protein n=1 Tax=Bradyrhizobium brasilense TaxID=1419277 RepID=UPI0024B10FB5|nr:trypsin-like peptidase domain-containing protein [Bradyrhizobium australafricanum]WFU33638.1 trypsin-like peptidase domain-containing protein [Bradyrhizobium australafricanum]
MASLHEILRQSVARIDLAGEFSGTGFFVEPGRLITCAHVTQRSGELHDEVLVCWMGREFPARVLSRYPPLAADDPSIKFWPYPDLAIIELVHPLKTDRGEVAPPVHHPCVGLDLSEPTFIPTADRIFTFGFTKGEHQEHIVAETPATLEMEGLFYEAGGTYLKLKGGQVLDGMSGGPVLNLRTGGVCGVTESRRGAGSAGGFVVPLFACREWLTESISSNMTVHASDRTWEIARSSSLGLRATLIIHPHVHMAGGALCCREAELHNLEEWLANADQRIFSIVAPGGQGKSALAWTFFDALRAQTESSFKGLFWYSFSVGGDHHSALARLRDAISAAKPNVAGLTLRQASPAVVVLDGLEVLLGGNGQLTDLLNPPERTMADPLIESLIREILDLPDVRVVVTSRIPPIFLDEPNLATQRVDLMLRPLVIHGSNAIWKNLGVDTTNDDSATATAFLRGSPLLIRLAARQILARGGMKLWLDENRHFFQGLAQDSRYQAAVSAHLFASLSKNAATALAVLAASSQRLAGSEWLSALTKTPGLFEDLDERQFRRIIREIIDLRLAAPSEDSNFEMHDLTAELFLGSLPESLRDAAFGAIDRIHGHQLIAPGFGQLSAIYDQSVIDTASLEALRNQMGYFESLLRRGALDDAEYVLANELSAPLRFRLGELRVLRSLLARLRAAYLERGGDLARAPARSDSAELCLLDGRADEALILLGNEGPASTIRACALFAVGRLDDGYREAQATVFDSISKLAIVESRDYTSLQLLADKMSMDRGSAIVEHGFALRTLALGLLEAGYPRTALLHICAAIRAVLGSAQPGILSMILEMLGRILLQLNHYETAAKACALATEAAQEMMVAEHLLAAEILHLELQMATGALKDLGDRAADRLAFALSHGFGNLGARCLSILERVEPRHDRTIARTARAQLTVRSVPPSNREHFARLQDELVILIAKRKSGHWIENDWLADQLWTEPTLSELIGDTAKQHFEMTTDIKLFLFSQVHSETGDSRSPSNVSDELARAWKTLELSERAAVPLAVVQRGYSGYIATELVFDRLLAGLRYHPRDRHLRSTLVDLARDERRATRLLEILGGLAQEQVDSAAICTDMATLYRRRGALDWSLIMSSEGHRAGMLTRNFLEEQIFLSNVLRFGLDVIAAGYPPEVAKNAVEEGLCYGPLMDGSLGPVQGPIIKLLGSKATAAEYAGPELTGRSIYDGVAYAFRRDLDPGSAPWWIFRIFQATFSATLEQQDISFDTWDGLETALGQLDREILSLGNDHVELTNRLRKEMARAQEHALSRRAT